jgi:RNA-directed DNA polymerase
MTSTKQFEIPKQLIWEAWKQVKSNKGSAGVDQENIELFNSNLRANLYKIWNRMSSGCYFPPSVKAVPIPKKSGGVRILGIPTVSDRVAQTAVKMVLEPMLEKEFLPDSYGYRPNKSAHQAIEVTRKRCWKYPWVLEFDIKALFDEIPHDLLLKAVKRHTECKWALMYIERWLKAPMQGSDGQVIERTKGTPQGGCVSPVLSNLFLHYVFDKWMTLKHPTIPWCRFADDGLLHCKSEAEAKTLLQELTNRFAECGLEIHPTKTRIVYCKDAKRREQNAAPTVFKFLGFVFKQRESFVPSKGKPFMGFQPAVCDEMLKKMRKVIKHQWRIRSQTDRALEEIAHEYNPIIQGWMNYYGAFYRSKLKSLGYYIDKQIMKWFGNKYIGFRKNRSASAKWLKSVYDKNPRLFAHWRLFPVY